MNSTTKAGLAELIGTFTLTFLGAGAGALAATSGAGLVGVAIAHGVALMVIIYTWGWVSGAHVNPAVTFAAWITGKVQFGTALLYWGSQFLGATLAAYILLYLLGPGSDLGQTIGSLTPVTELKSTTGEITRAASAGDPVKVIVVEAILTFFLVSAVFSSGIAGKNGNIAGVAIGFVLIADIICGGALTGASMNPARTFGPALAKADLSYVWMYVVGPVLGGLVAGLLYNTIILSPENEKKKH